MQGQANFATECGKPSRDRRVRKGLAAGSMPGGVPGSVLGSVVRIVLLGAALALPACTVGPDFAIPPAPVVALTPKPLKAPGTAGKEAQRFVQGLGIPGAW